MIDKREFETVFRRHYDGMFRLTLRNEIDAVGHRMVHGGEKFNKSVLLTDEVLKVFEECSDLAPLHNPANLKGVNAVKELLAAEHVFQPCLSRFP